MTHPPQSKPFPWKCGHCKQREVRPAVVPYATEAEHDGRTYEVTVPELRVPRCENCGQLVLDSAANKQITEALRQQLGLLSPEQIRASRESLALTQRQLASRLGIAEGTLSRWETGGQIQQRAFDRLLRVYFCSAVVRQAWDDAVVLACGERDGGAGTDGTSSQATACLPGNSIQDQLAEQTSESADSH